MIAQYFVTLYQYQKLTNAPAASPVHNHPFTLPAPFSKD